MRVMADSAVPPGGLMAEGEKRWNDAVKIYKAAIAKDSTREDLWMRISQIDASLGLRDETAQALLEASKLKPNNAPLQFQLAQAYSLANKPAPALEAIDRALTIAPSNLEYLRARAVYTEWLGKADEAFSTYKRILVIAPGDDNALTGLAGAASVKGKREDYQVVALSLLKASELKPKDAGLQFRTAQACSLASQPDESLAAIDRALAIEPKNLEYLRARALYANWLDKANIAVETYRRILAISPNDENALACLEGIAPVKGERADYEAVADELRKAAALKPKDAKLEFKTAEIYSLAGKPEQALEAVDRALAVEPRNLEYLRARAVYAGWLGKTAIAGATYVRIIEIVPGDEDALVGLAQAASATGQPADRAAFAETMRKAAALKPNDAALQFRSAQAYSIADNPKMALEAVNRALALDPKNLEYLRDRASYANWIGDVDTAAETYKRILAIVPDDKDAIIGLEGATSWKEKPADREAVAESLRKAAALKPNDAKLQSQLAQAYAMADKPDQALAAIEVAVTLDPKNADYLMARSQYANELGRFNIAADSYRRIAAISPNDDNAILNLARAESAEDKLDDSARTYKKYLKKHPENKDALMEYIKVESWRGNFATAMKSLEDYKQRYGETMDYRKQKARILASANRPAAAMDVIQPLLKETPDDYEVIYSETEALENANKYRDALKTLAILEKLRPESSETEEMRKVATANIRTYLAAGVDYYTESDSDKILSGHGEGGYQFNPEIRLTGGGDYHQLRADVGSGLESVDGRKVSHESDLWVGINDQATHQLDLMGRAGAAKEDTVSVGDNLFIYDVEADYRPADSVTFMLANSRDYYVISPRAVSFGVNKDDTSLRMLWTPDLNYTLDASGEYDSYSDANRSWQAVLAPRRSVLRSEWLNLDLGLYLWWLGFNNNPNDGYYSPLHYERYAVKADGYWKFDDNNGIGLVFTAGEEKDETESGFSFGTSGDVDGQFGVYRDWILRLHAGYTHNVRTATGNYDARIYGANLERRF